MTQTSSSHYRRRSKLASWVYHFGGVNELAQTLGVKHQAVTRWLRREGSPQLRHAQALIELSKGELTSEIILRDTQPLNK